MAKKPLIFGPGMVTPDGDAPEPYLQPDYIPGYSEIVKARDVEKAEYLNDGSNTRGLSESQKRAYYRKVGAQPQKTEYEFMWLRVAGPGGGQSFEADREMMFHRHDGWEVIKVDSEADFTEKYGFGFPPAAHLAPDGTIRQLDVALAAIPSEVARRNELARQAKNEAALRAEREARTGPSTGMDVSVSVEDTGSVSVTNKPNV